MARKNRTVIPGVPLHMIQRGNNRQACFFVDQDYQFYLECLSERPSNINARCMLYVLMTNHVHLLLTPSTENGPSRLMQSVDRRYVQYINYTYRRSGTLWEGRFKASMVHAEEYLLNCYRYIELNPVRAGMVDRPEQYRWSSHAIHMGQVPNRFLEDHVLFEALGTSVETRQKVYRALFDAHPDPVDDAMIRKSARNNWPTESDQFRGQIESMLERALMPARRGRPRKIEMHFVDYRVKGP